jgi:pimeloyl-ACP methyl ester carboxylesterase
MPACCIRLLLILPLALALGGCASSTYDGLVSQDDIPDLVALTEDAAAWPNSTSRHPTMIGDGPPVCVSVRKTGNKQANRILVFLHGCVSDHRTWRFVRGALAQHYCLILVDLPGCGDSDRTDPERLGPNGYSPDALAERVLQALDAELANRKGRWRITLIGHSLGGMVALRMMGNPEFRRPHGRLLGRIDQTVLLSPGDFAIVNPCPDLVRIAKAKPWSVVAADLFGLLRDGIAKGIRESFADPKRALREEADRLLAILRHRETRLAQQAMLRQAVPRQADRLDWPAIRKLEADYANVPGQILIVCGEQDETIPVATAYKLAAQLPDAELRIVPDCKHSIHLDRPRLCAQIIRSFVDPRESALANSQEEMAPDSAPRLALVSD